MLHSNLHSNPTFCPECCLECVNPHSKNFGVLKNGLHSKFWLRIGVWIALQKVGVLKYPESNEEREMEGGSKSGTVGGWGEVNYGYEALL